MKMRRIMITIIIILLILGAVFRTTIIKLYDGYKDRKQSMVRAKLYVLTNGSEFQDITQKLILDHSISNDLKQPLIIGERKIAIFKYKSGSETVAGYISYLTHGTHPVIVFLRGGNGYYGIMRPNNRYSLWDNYNVVGTLYRGNIYGGDDEFGGDDVSDVENLMRYFPKIEMYTGITMRAPYSMTGVSRGSMQMFTALSRSKYIQDHVDQAISISGNLSLFSSAKNRLDMRLMFFSKYLYSNTHSLDEWIKHRDPVSNAGLLSKSLRVLLFYGLSDKRVALVEQNEMKKALDEYGITNTLITYQDGDHGLSNHLGEVMSVVANSKKVYAK